MATTCHRNDFQCGVRMAAHENPLDSVIQEDERSSKVSSREKLPPRIRRFRMHPKSRVMLIVVVVLVLAAAGYWLWYYLDGYESTDDAQVDVHIAPISARISGYVMKVNVDDNQFVENQAVLLEIDPKDYQVAVEKARADLANAEANAQSLQINV